MQVKSVLDPCKDDNEENNDENVSLGDDSDQKDGSSDAVSEVCYLYTFLPCFHHA